MEDNKQQVVDTVDTTTAKADETGAKATKPEFNEEQQKYIDELINKQYAKLQSKAEEKLKALEQAEKLKSMSEVERAKEELKLAKEKLAEYENEKLVNQFKVELTTKGLKADFAELIPVSDADKAKKAVDFLGSYKEEIEKPLLEKIKVLEEQLRNTALKGGVPSVPSTSTEAPKSLKKVY